MKALLEAHAFRDGNKRTAFLAARTLLEANGKRFDRVHEFTEVEFTLAVEKGLSISRMAQWFANHARGE